jgi:hypothetical protein
MYILPNPHELSLIYDPHPLLILTHRHQLKDDFIILQKLNFWVFSIAFGLQRMCRIFKNIFRKHISWYNLSEYVLKNSLCYLWPEQQRKMSSNIILLSLGEGGVMRDEMTKAEG